MKTKDKKAKVPVEDKDCSKADSSESEQTQAKAQPLTPYGKKISEGFENLSARERWFRQRSGNRSK